MNEVRSDKFTAANTGTSARTWFRQSWVAVFLYLLATAITGAYFMGDTLDYSHSIVTHAAGRDDLYWEFGHLLWRPLGYVLFRLTSPIAHWFVGGDEQASATLILMSVSWLAGLLSVLSLYGIVNKLGCKRWAVWTTIVAFVFAQAFLNYVQTGAPYVPGLGLLLLGIYLLVVRGEKPKRSFWTALMAGASLAGSVLLWFPYLLAVPAALVSALCLFGLDRKRLGLAIQAAVVFGLVVAFAYLLVMAHIGVHNVHDLRAWMQQTSRATGSSNRGVSKMIFGFARSFINMGNDGVLFKRFLLHDPFNPVSALDLVRLSLWKLVSFYLFLSCLLLSLLSDSRGRRVLTLLLINGLPVIAFAVYWQGGDPERYLPLYPLMFIALVSALESGRAKQFFRYPLLLFVAAMTVTNVSFTARPVLNRQQEASAARIRELAPALKPASWTFTANWQDDLVNFNRSFPLNPINRSGTLHIGALISPGEPEVAHWQREFASRAQGVWARDGAVWLSRRLLAARPQPEWNWVEGDDRRVSWNDLYAYASRLELGQSVGGADGFVLLVPSQRNQKILEESR